MQSMPAIMIIPFLLLPACRSASPGRMVDVGGLSLHIHCVGEGAPIVVLEAGLGNDGSVWNKVEPEIGRFTRACDYDRAGMGHSSPAPRPHTNRQMAQELHQLLGRAGLAGPYVLVGHSMGGVNVRLFASEHENEVAGMVLVDAPTGAAWSRAFALHSEASKAEFKAGLLKLREGLDFDTYTAGFADMETSSRSLGDMPFIVLTRGKEPVPPPPGVSVEIAAQVAAVHREGQAELPRLSSNSAQVIALNSRHFIQWDAPKLVVGAVHEVVDAARTHRRVDASVLSALAREGPP
jgi:pimeloyl-ACP methyl ester carboxylesterase